MVYTSKYKSLFIFHTEKKQRLSENVTKVVKHLFNNALFYKSDSKMVYLP